MKMRINPRHLVPVAAVAVMVLVVAACAIQLRRDETVGSMPSSVSRETDPFASELSHCRTVTPDETVALENCRRVWAQNRRRFLTSTKPRWDAPTEEIPTRPSSDMEPRHRVLPPEPKPGQREAR
jgi:conjugative transfer region protein TrbK